MKSGGPASLLYDNVQCFTAKKKDESTSVYLVVKIQCCLN